jgi:riboflavin synthase
VAGHVDGVGQLTARQATENWDVLNFAIPYELSRYLVPQGSITIDGVSLTVVGVDDGPDPSFEVSLIPTTLNATTLGRMSIGSAVNLEVDMIGKYVQRLLAIKP